MNPTPPREALNRYLNDKSTDVTESTLRNYRTTLTTFVDWLEGKGITDLNTLDSNELQRFKEARQQDVKTITLKTDMTQIKGFIRFCEHINAVPNDLHMMVRIPKPADREEVADDVLSREEARQILEYLDQHEYSSLRHVTFLILWKTGVRRSSLYALDKQDFDDGSKPYLRVRHRPETGIPLKNKRKGERDIRINRETADVIRDFFQFNHPGGEDEKGRVPLLMSTQGKRCNTSTIVRQIYTATRTCHHTGECPMGRNLSECEATTYNSASECPASVSPHALRRGYVTEALNAGQPKEVTADRVDMSREVLDKHYDHGSKGEKMDRREEYLVNI